MPVGVKASEYFESFIQEWVWFGLLHEFEMECSLDMHVAAFIQPGSPGQGRVLSTKTLVGYMRAVLINRLRQQEVPLDLRPGDWVYLSTPALHLATVGHTGPAQIEAEQDDMRYKITDPNAASDVWWEEPASILRRAYDKQDPVMRPENQARLNAASLILLSQLLHHSHSVEGDRLLTSSETNKRHKKTRSKLAPCIREARRVRRILFDRDDPGLRMEIALSIDILSYGLRDTMIRISGEIYEIQSPHVSSYLQIFQKKMADQNWCPARCNMMLCTDETLAYITSLLPSNEAISHNDCGDIACCHRPQAVGQLEAKHQAGVCTGLCPLMVFEERELISIILSGGNPGISERQSSSGEVTYEVTNTAGKDYVAISHVWSHGLGNPLQNALPLCQIRRLFQLIKALGSPDTVLWIDTLCVPITPEFKRLAILRLRDVYRDADKVLVLDRHVLQVGDSWVEQTLQLICSEWMRRLWTLQEGRLTTNLFIQFKNKAVQITHLTSKNRRTLDENELDPFGVLSHKLTFELERHFAKRENSNQRLLDLASDLTHRSVTVPSDEPICIATMLGLALEDFHPYPTMADIYRSLPNIPRDILFLFSTRLQVPGLRWAPSTFLEQGLQVFSQETDPAYLTKDGLLLRKDCVFLHEGLDFERDDTLPREIYRIECPGGPRLAFQCHDNSVAANSMPPVQPLCLESAAILLQYDGERFRNYSRGILVSGLQERDGITYCHCEMGLFMMKVNDFIQEDIDAMMQNPLQKSFSVIGDFRPQSLICVD